jgi:DNA-binding cell septation regulator SpoVG
MSASSTDAAGRGTSPVTVTEVKLRFVEDGRDGLIGWASCLLNGTVVLNNIGVRRGREGGLFLTYPNKVSATGTRLTLFHPVSSDAAAILESAIVGKVRELIGAAGASASGRAG